MTTVTLDKVENFIDSYKEVRTNEYLNWKSACAYDVVVGNDSFPCQTLKEAIDLAKEFEISGENAKIIMPNGDEYVEEVKEKLNETDALCSRIFGTLHPKKKDYEFTLKQLLNEPEYRSAAYMVVYYGTTGRVSPKAQVKLTAMSGRQVIQLVVETKKGLLGDEIKDRVLIDELILKIRK